MKIKELHLRNIASIEEADIDFEKGLNDGVTGTPASVFLISGDTGAGKSVILDGISMALYKNTPRIAGVANTNKNEFTDAEGESIRVGSIEQYTRLGISDKDECYSEVAFTGNDGVDYRAKLSLGMLLGNTDKATGIRPMKHRTPKWEIKVGSGDWTKDNVEQTILDAVGLSFEQFGRMAMLAQGQFAAFLTGDKKEREAILEQLTNTEHFTSYGKAIKSLFDKAKSGLSTAQVAYDTEAEHTLPQEKVDALTQEKANLQKEKDALDIKDNANDLALTHVSTIETNRAAADREEAERLKFAETAAGNEYKEAKTLVADWDTTVAERQRLSDRRTAVGKLDAEKKTVIAQKETFSVLSADLEARREALKTQGDPQKAVEDKQKEIDALNEQLTALNPSKINESLSEISGSKTELGTLTEREKQISDKAKEAGNLKAEIERDEKTAENNKEALDKAQSAYDAAKSKADETNNRLATMSTGIDKALVNIRKRLVSEHAEVCPLCGSHINEIPLDNEFKNILTPFEIEQKAAAEALVSAEKIRDDAKSVNDNFNGALKIKRGNLEKMTNEISAATKKLGQDAAKFGIDAGKSLFEQITAVVESLTRKETDLKAQQKQAENVQGKLNAAQNDKKPLDAALRKYNADDQVIKNIERVRTNIVNLHPDWEQSVSAKKYECSDITSEWSKLYREATTSAASVETFQRTIEECDMVLGKFYATTGKTESDLDGITAGKDKLEGSRKFVKDIDENLKSKADAVKAAKDNISAALKALSITDEKDVPAKEDLQNLKTAYKAQNDELVGKINVIKAQLDDNSANITRLANAKAELDKATALYNKWNILNGYFGGTRFRTLVQTYILRPLLNNANIYLEKITDRYTLTCSEDNEQLSILVLDRYNKDQIRSVTVLSGGERFMISLALSLALSSLNRPDMNVNILFIDEGFGTLDEKSLDSVMETLEKLQEIAGQSERRVGIISHREELDERIPVQIQVKKKGEGRSRVEISNTL